MGCVVLSIASTVVGTYNILLIRFYPQLDLLNLFANLMIVSVSLLPSVMTTALARMTIGLRYGSPWEWPAYAFAGSLGTGSLFIWFDQGDSYFTPIGISYIFCAVGILLGAMVGLGYLFSAQRSLLRDGETLEA